MKDLIKSIMIVVSIFQMQNCFAEGVEASVRQDIVSMLGGGSENSPVQVETDGVYVDSKVCKNSPSPLTVQLKDRLKIQQDQALIGLFQQILCAPRNDQLDIDLTPFSANLYESIPVEMVLYSRQQELGRWLLDNNEFSVAFAPIHKNQMKINLTGLNPNSSIPAVTFWQTLSPEHIRVWYGQFKMAPSDAIIFDFKFENKKWLLTYIWIGSRI
ncbi:hypothetical protein BEN71_01215 [Acinetobacter wuhouensis]|uniref:hypothetical protein n=1 Tax=Acinetobacter wuhouensis TaxID=1879050 RepID=UPI00083AD0A9|nr:hypothetical protein [Acinetobacter wuhouensis]AXQ20799.1 hypothetical protein BEN71_01215 [Acinetobacter wuhouensis]